MNDTTVNLFLIFRYILIKTKLLHFYTPSKIKQIIRAKIASHHFTVYMYLMENLMINIGN